LLAALLLCAAGGCGVSHNPAYFPNYFFPFGDIIPTHAKPGGPGYYNNFDPHAVRLEVRPIAINDCNAVNQVRTQHVMLATIYDENNQPRRNRRVEWMIEGVGNIMEVDESGVFAGRGYKTNNKHGVSYTGTHENRVSRGNGNTADDYMVRPGQTWCTISSAVEGDTHVTVYAPGIYDWEKNKVYATIRWVDCVWEFPQPAQARFGSEHVFTTKVYRATDKQPLAGYRVRYRILDGPAAVFLPSQTTDFTAVSDLAGNAQVAIRQAVAAYGINRIGMEIIRPPDPNAPSGSGVVIARGETSIEWLAPNVMLNHTGPASAVVGQEITYTTSVQNQGKIDSQGITITAPLPDGLEYVRSQPAAFVDDKQRQLVWTLPVLPPGQSQSVQAVYKTLRQGTVTSSAIMATAEGQRDQKDVVTQVHVAALRLTLTGPPTAVVGQPITLQMNVTNPGSGPLENVLLTAQFDANLKHESGINTLNLQLGTLQPGETRPATLTLTPRAAGRLATKVIATANNLSDSAEHIVAVQEAQLGLNIDGPSKRYVGRNADWTIRVENPSDAPLPGVLVRDKLPPELQFIVASQQGQHQNGEVVWNLGTLGPREVRTLQLTTRCVNLAKQATKTVLAASESGLRKEDSRSIEIFGLAALKLELTDQGDPAPIGGKITYQAAVTNQGTLAASEVDVKITIPAETKLLDARSTIEGQKPVISPDGRVIQFAKANNVAPGARIVYVIEVEAMRAGDARCRIDVSSPVLTAGPEFEEEPTRIYDPTQAPAVPPPPLPPGE
jgi:uncharacterized repeat protein (TIGR01451 family)